MNDVVKILNERYTTKKYKKNIKFDINLKNTIKEVLISSPSSLNIQPWEFILVESDSGKDKIIEAYKDFGINYENIKDCSLIVLFLKKNNLDQEHIKNVVDKENKDNRYLNEEMYKNTLDFKLNTLKMDKNIQSRWLEKQLYLNCGYFVLAMHLLGINSTIMEGFDKKKIDDILKLKEKNLSSVLTVALGYSDVENDYNKKLKKSRLDYKDLVKEI